MTRCREWDHLAEDATSSSDDDDEVSRDEKSREGTMVWAFPGSGSGSGSGASGDDRTTDRPTTSPHPTVEICIDDEGDHAVKNEEDRVEEEGDTEWLHIESVI